jgi:hypothetical protein
MIVLEGLSRKEKHWRAMVRGSTSIMYVYEYEYDHEQPCVHMSTMRQNILIMIRSHWYLK